MCTDAFDRSIQLDNIIVVRWFPLAGMLGNAPYIYYIYKSCWHYLKQGLTCHFIHHVRLELIGVQQLNHHQVCLCLGQANRSHSIDTVISVGFRYSNCHHIISSVVILNLINYMSGKQGTFLGWIRPWKCVTRCAKVSVILILFWMPPLINWYNVQAFFLNQLSRTNLSTSLTVKLSFSLIIYAV